MPSERVSANQEAYYGKHINIALPPLGPNAAVNQNRNRRRPIDAFQGRSDGFTFRKMGWTVTERERLDTGRTARSLCSGRGGEGKGGFASSWNDLWLRPCRSRDSISTKEASTSDDEITNELAEWHTYSSDWAIKTAMLSACITGCFGASTYSTVAAALNLGTVTKSPWPQHVHDFLSAFSFTLILLIYALIGLCIYVFDLCILKVR